MFRGLIGFLSYLKDDTFYISNLGELNECYGDLKLTGAQIWELRDMIQNYLVYRNEEFGATGMITLVEFIEYTTLVKFRFLEFDNCVLREELVWTVKRKESK